MAHGGMLYVVNWSVTLEGVAELPQAFVRFNDVMNHPEQCLRTISARFALPLPLGEPRPAFPSALVTGSLGKTTVCRMLVSILSGIHMKVGLTTTQGCYVNSHLVPEGDSSNCRWARSRSCCCQKPAKFSLVSQAREVCNLNQALCTKNPHLGVQSINGS